MKAEIKVSFINSYCTISYFFLIPFISSLLPVLCIFAYCVLKSFFVHDVLLLVGINKCFIMVYCPALKRCSVLDVDNLKYFLRVVSSLILLCLRIEMLLAG